MQCKLTICDYATGGLLENTLLTPVTRPYLHFVEDNKATIVIKGLKEFWQAKEAHETQLKISFKDGTIHKKNIPFRGNRVKQYAVEYICQQIENYL